MNTSKKLATAALVSLCMWSCSTDSATTDSSASDNQAIECIMTRTSVRDYTDAEVTDAQVETMLRAAMAAPTAVNRQPWAFVVVRDRSLLDQVADSIASMKMAAKAPLAIVVCGDMTRTLDGDGHDFWIQDVSAATENLLLAANAQGLGAVWCGVYPLAQRVAFISDLLSLPDTIVPLAFVPIGVPAGDQTPKDKWNPDRVRQDRWQ